MNAPTIESFKIDHDILMPGIYVSRVDGDVTTYDLRTRRPNRGDYMDNLTMHSVEHMFATYIRCSAIGSQVLYFGPMGCQTGFYLLVKNADHEKVLAAVRDTLDNIVSHSECMFGDSAKECGNYRNLSLSAAQLECARYLAVLNATEPTFRYPEK